MLTPVELIAGLAVAVPVGCALGVIVAVLASWGRA